MTRTASRPVCPHCGAGSIYVRSDGSIQCRRCGHDSRKG